MRIRNWHFAIRHYTEMIPRNVIVGAQDPNFLEQLSKNITRQGMTNVTLNYLRVRKRRRKTEAGVGHVTFKVLSRASIKFWLFFYCSRIWHLIFFYVLTCNNMKNKSFKAILWINHIPWGKLHICLIANLYVTLLSVTNTKIIETN